MPRIAGYTYQADNYCTCCFGRTKYCFGSMTNGYTNTEQALDAHAARLGVDREDESSFDSGQFPKVIFSTDHAGQCGNCGEDI